MKNKSADVPTPDLKLCLHCGETFKPRRSNQTNCSEKCRKAKHQKKERVKYPINSANSRSKLRDNLLFFDRAMRLSELLYTSPQGERLGIMKDFIDAARSGCQSMINILTNKYLLRNPDGERWMHWRGQRWTYPTITQAADAYCRKFWRASVEDVVRHRVAEPETGEVFVTNPSSPYVIREPEARAA